MSTALSVEREQQLLAQASSTERVARDDAFAELVRALGPSLLSLCLGITGNRADAEDALQDTLCSVPAELPRFRGEARLYTWCHRIALRAAVRVRALNRRRDVAHDATPTDAGEARLVERDAARRTLDAMTRLPLEQRAVMALFLEGASHEQIADVLGVPVGTVWSRLHSGRKRLRELLDG